MNKRIAFVSERNGKVRVYFGSGDAFSHSYWKTSYVREIWEALRLIERVWKTNKYTFRPFWGMELGMVFEKEEEE